MVSLLFPNKKSLPPLVESRHRLPLPGAGPVRAAWRCCQSPEPAQAARKHVSGTGHPSGETEPQAGTWAPGRLQHRCSALLGDIRGSQGTTEGAEEPQMGDFPTRSIIISLFSLNILSHRYYISSSFNYHLYLVDSFQKSVFPVLSIHLNFTYSNCLMDISNGLAYHNKNNIYKITLNIFQHLSSLSLSPSPL